MQLFMLNQVKTALRDMLEQHPTMEPLKGSHMDREVNLMTLYTFNLARSVPPVTSRRLHPTVKRRSYKVANLITHYLTYVTWNDLQMTLKIPPFKAERHKAREANLVEQCT